MPLYEYACEACGKRFEVIQKFSDPAPDACRKCGGGPVHRQHSSPAIQFKGSGWYVTDYAQKSKGESGASTGEGGSSSPADGTSAAAPSKADTPAKTDTPAKASAPATPSPASSTSKE
jgi:putative FmdB family regulatory protein